MLYIHDISSTAVSEVDVIVACRSAFERSGQRNRQLTRTVLLQSRVLANKAHFADFQAYICVVYGINSVHILPTIPELLTKAHVIFSLIAELHVLKGK